MKKEKKNKSWCSRRKTVSLRKIHVCNLCLQQPKTDSYCIVHGPFINSQSWTFCCIRNQHNREQAGHKPSKVGRYWANQGFTRALPELRRKRFLVWLQLCGSRMAFELSVRKRCAVRTSAQIEFGWRYFGLFHVVACIRRTSTKYFPRCMTRRNVRWATSGHNLWAYGVKCTFILLGDTLSTRGWTQTAEDASSVYDATRGREQFQTKIIFPAVKQGLMVAMKIAPIETTSVRKLLVLFVSQKANNRLHTEWVRIRLQTNS